MLALVLAGCAGSTPNNPPAANNSIPQTQSPSQAAAQPAPTQTYACPDGTVVTDLSKCQKQKCPDGTEYGRCSSTKPKFCTTTGELTVDFSKCGCPASCDDGQANTIDTCDVNTNYECQHKFNGQGNAMVEAPKSAYAYGCLIGDKDCIVAKISDYQDLLTDVGNFAVNANIDCNNIASVYQTFKSKVEQLNILGDNLISLMDANNYSQLYPQPYAQISTSIHNMKNSYSTSELASKEQAAIAECGSSGVQQSARDELKAQYMQSCSLTNTCGKISSESLKSSCYQEKLQTNKEYACCVYADDNTKRAVDWTGWLPTSTAADAGLAQIGFDTSRLTATAAEECMLHRIFINSVLKASADECAFMADADLRNYCYYRIATWNSHYFAVPAACEKIDASDMRDMCLSKTL